MELPVDSFLIETGIFIGAGYYVYKESKNLKRPIILNMINTR